MILDIAFKMLPSLISILLCWKRFNLTQIARGIEAYPYTCNDFEKVKDSGYPCLQSGTTALSVVLAVFSLGISVVIISHFSGLPRIAQGGAFSGLLTIFVVFLYIQELDSGAFTLRGELPKSSWGSLRRIGRNPALWTNILCTVSLLLYQLYILFIIPWLRDSSIFG